MGEKVYNSQKMPAQARKACELGATDSDLAGLFGVTSRAIYKWRVQYPEFADACKVGKDHADNRVERSLYSKATGGYYTEQQAIKIKTGDGLEAVEVVEVEKFREPCTTAARYWLNNRRKDVWKDKQEVEHTHTGDFFTQIGKQLAQREGEDT